MKINGNKLKKELIKKAESQGVKVVEIKNSIREALGVGRQTISLWCTGKVLPETEKLIFLRTFFKLKKIEELLK